MTQTHYIRTPAGDRIEAPVKPLTAVLSFEVHSLASSVYDGENSREELVRYVQDLVHEAAAAEAVTTVVLRLTAVIDNDYSTLCHDELLSLAKTTVEAGTELTWDQSIAEAGLDLSIEYLPGNTLDDLIRLVEIWVTDDDYSSVGSRAYLNPQTRVLYRNIANLMEQHFIDRNGRLDRSDINYVLDELSKREISADHLIIEQDSFGPLICALKTSKGRITYG